METVFSSEQLKPGRRLAAFDEFQATGPHPMRVLSEQPRSFHATVRAVDLETADVVELSCSSAEVHRTAQLIRAHDPRLYAVVFPLRGRVVVTQSGRQAVLRDRDFALYDSTHPLQVRIVADGATATLVRTQVPRELVTLPPRQVDRMLGVAISGRTGVGALLTSFLARLTTDCAAYRAADVPRLGGITVDLVSAAIAHQLDTEPDHSRRNALLAHLKEYVRDRLHDPELSPRSIAAAHHISVSYLHRLFRAHGIGVSAWIRQLRLDHARRDLGDPALFEVTVSRIAARWGFHDHATFTRAFRTAYGVAPSDYRHRVLGFPA